MACTAVVTPHRVSKTELSIEIPWPRFQGTEEGELRTVYGTELMVVYVVVSVRVAVVVTVSVSNFVVTLVWSIVIVVGLTLVVFQ